MVNQIDWISRKTGACHVQDLIWLFVQKLTRSWVCPSYSSARVSNNCNLFSGPIFKVYDDHFTPKLRQNSPNEFLFALLFLNQIKRKKCIYICNKVIRPINTSLSPFCDFGIGITSIFTANWTIFGENFVSIWKYSMYYLWPKSFKKPIHKF